MDILRATSLNGVTDSTEVTMSRYRAQMGKLHGGWFCNLANGPTMVNKKDVSKLK